MVADLNAIISRTAGTTPLRRRQARETLRSVYRVDGFIVKEFDIPAGCRRYRRPWLVEDAAIRRLGPGYAGASLGVVEQVEGGLRKVFLVKRFVEGVPLATITAADIPDVARLLSAIHAAGVVMNDAHADNFLRTPDGGLVCLDFGRSSVFRHGPAPVFAIGRELEHLRREGLECDDGLFDAFMCAYFEEARPARMRRVSIVLSARIAIMLRAMRKGKGR